MHAGWIWDFGFAVDVILGHASLMEFGVLADSGKGFKRGIAQFGLILFVQLIAYFHVSLNSFVHQ